jgi:hypothetical protein
LTFPLTFSFDLFPGSSNSIRLKAFLNLFKNNSTPERPRESRHILERVQKIMQSGEGARRTGMIGLLVRFTAAPAVREC